jgi:hypothetical protein
MAQYMIDDLEDLSVNQRTKLGRTSSSSTHTVSLNRHYRFIGRNPFGIDAYESKIQNPKSRIDIPPQTSRLKHEIGNVRF